MEGIEQWYSEKSDYVNEVPNRATGHYTAMIDPRYNYVGMGGIGHGGIGNDYQALELSEESSLDETKNSFAGDTSVNIEVSLEYIRGIELNKTGKVYLEEGNTYKTDMNIMLLKDIGEEESCAYAGGGDWESLDESVATVDSNGIVTARQSGTTQITFVIGDYTQSYTVNVYKKGELPIEVTPPSKTVYKLGESLDLKDAKLTDHDNDTTVDLTQDMVSGFSSEKAGICNVSVTYGDFTTEFETLIIDVPSLTADCGQTLGQVSFPENEYGKYIWASGSETKVLDKIGSYSFKASFVPNDTENLSTLTDIDIEVKVFAQLDNNTKAELTTDNFTYDGTPQSPKPEVTYYDTTLTEGEDYELIYDNNINAGTATVTINGIGYYKGSVTKNFEIEKSPLVIKAKSKHILIKAALPTLDEYEYVVTGLAQSDTLLKAPTLSCDIKSTEKAGKYTITPSGADAGGNYTISYENGELVVAEESYTYTVTYDVQGHGNAPDENFGVKAGSNIEAPNEPTAQGYVFEGWYKEKSCTNAWDFDNDIVQSDTTLYAKWLVADTEGGLRIHPP
jgi:uncharacterized repeat protein (TIGR02543 family)